MKNLKVVGGQSVGVDLHPIKTKAKVITEAVDHRQSLVIKGVEEGR